MNETPRSISGQCQQTLRGRTLDRCIALLYVGDKREVPITCACLLKGCINLKEITEELLCTGIVKVFDIEVLQFRFHGYPTSQICHGLCLEDNATEYYCKQSLAMQSLFVI